MLAILNSAVVDFCARQKTAGNHMTYFIVKQLPVISPAEFAVGPGVPTVSGSG